MSNIAVCYEHCCIPPMNLIFDVESFMCSKCSYFSWFRKMSDQEEEFDTQNVVKASEENEDAFEIISIPVPSEEFSEPDQTEDNESEVEPSSEDYTTHVKESYQSLPNVEPEDEEHLMEEALLPKQASYSPRNSTEHDLTKYENAVQPAERYSNAGSLAFLDKIKAIKESLKASVKDPLATGTT